MSENENIVDEQPVVESDLNEVETSVENAELSPEEQKYEEAKNFAKWYVLHTFSGYENVAKENLTNSFLGLNHLD